MRKLLLCLLFCFCANAHALTFAVNSTADTAPNACTDINVGDGCTLREAIEHANADRVGLPSLIIFDDRKFGSAQTITLTSPLPAFTQDILFDGPKARVTITGQREVQQFRVFEVGAGVTALFNDLIIRNSFYGIINLGSTKIGDSDITGNTYGLFAGGPELTVINCLINSNSFGIIGSNGAANALDCTFRDNVYAILNQGNQPFSASGCTFPHNGLRAFSNEGSGAATFTKCNIADSPHGLTNQGSGTLTVTDSTLTGHTYGLYALNAGTVTATNCTLSGNHIGIASSQSTINATNCTISGNATAIGHGLTALGPVTLRTCIAVGNTDGLGEPFINGGYNITSGTAAEAGLQVRANGTVVLKDNGGPTPTIALTSNGTAVNAGDNSLVPTGTIYDQRGHGFARINGGVVDIGAYESDLRGSVITIGDALPVREGSAAAPGVATFTVTLSAPVTRTVTVHYATANGTRAFAGQDFVPASGTLTFAPGQTRQKVIVTLIGDDISELNESFFVRLSSPNNVSSGILDGAVYIMNDDGPSIAIHNAPTVMEGNRGTTLQVFTVTLSAASTHEVSVEWATANNTAGPADFVAASGGLYFAPGQTSKIIVVQVKGDTLVEPTELYRINLRNPRYGLLADAQAAGFIANDDVAPLPGDEPSS